MCVPKIVFKSSELKIREMKYYINNSRQIVSYTTLCTSVKDTLINEYIRKLIGIVILKKMKKNMKEKFLLKETLYLFVVAHQCEKIDKCSYESWQQSTADETR